MRSTEFLLAKLPSHLSKWEIFCCSHPLVRRELRRSDQILFCLHRWNGLLNLLPCHTEGPWNIGEVVLLQKRTLLWKLITILHVYSKKQNKTHKYKQIWWLLFYSTVYDNLFHNYKKYNKLEKSKYVSKNNMECHVAIEIIFV